MSELIIRLEPADRGRHRVVVENGETVHLDTINVSSDLSRRRFINKLIEKADALAGEREHIDRELIRMAAAPRPEPPAPAAGPADDPWPDPVDAAALLDELVGLIGSYVVLPGHAAEVLALWLAHTYVTGVTDYTPYVWVSSPVRECGKSTLLELLSLLAFRGQMTGGITAAALYRRIHRLAPTMLLDELDTRLRGDGGELLRGVLNTGFHKSGKFTICVGDDHRDEDFNTFCPKVLAGIGRLWDTVASRSVPIRLRRASKDELKRLRKIRGDRIAGELLPYRRRLLRLARDLQDRLTVAEAVTPESLTARQADVWRILLAVADAAAGHWPVAARAAAEAIHGGTGDESDHGLLLLEDLRDLFDREGADALFSEFIVGELVKHEGRPWPEYRGDRSLTKNGLASLLRRFDVRPLTVRVGPETAKGYRLADLASAFATYLPQPPGTLERTVTPVTTPETKGETRDDGVAGVTADPELVTVEVGPTTAGGSGGNPQEVRECDGCDGSNPGGACVRKPDPALPTTWIGRDDKGRADPGGTLPAGWPLPGHATYWRQPGMADWCEV